MKNEWIRCNKRLPDKDDIVLVIHEINPMPIDYEYNVTICRFDGEVFVHPSGLSSTHEIGEFDADDGEFPVTHWMQLPQPPKD